VTTLLTVADDAGEPLDIHGQFSPGTIAISLVLARLTQAEDAQAGPYVAYTTRQQTSTITGQTATQAAADQGGSFSELSPGAYRYSFSTAVEVPDPSLTQTVGAYAERAVEGQSYVADQELSFVPDGSAVTLRRELVTDAACNRCHGELSAHGGVRRGTQLCILCHTPQSTDPDTLNTVDFRVMVHKIHMGEQLPSVEQGTPYQIIGFQQAVNDFSEVAFPQPVNNCEACHGGAAHGDLAYQRPSRAVCGSCHDTTAFSQPVPAGDVLHDGGPQPNDSQCAVCHPPSGGVAGIRDQHLVGLVDPSAPALGLSILSIEQTAPGQTPAVTFTVQVNGAPRDIMVQPLDGLRATIAGPNDDYAQYWQATLQASTGAVGTLAVVDATTGKFQYTFPASAAIPANASGSYTLALEGFLQPIGFPRLPALTPVVAFAVTDATATARRTVVSNDNCNACHYELTAHGGMRRNPQYCPMCHNPNNVNDQGAPRFEGQQQQLVPSLDFKIMIHKLHSGDPLTQSYVVGGFPLPTPANPGGTPNDFSQVRFPQDLGDCTVCHVDQTYQIPLPDGRLPSLIEQRRCTEPVTDDADNYCEDPFLITDKTLLPPHTAVCTSCHDAAFTSAHAETMTTSQAEEACATCHRPEADFGLAKVHVHAP
jgi:OmcA/MtrC family decaheme c-type cytochrome